MQRSSPRIAIAGLAAIAAGLAAAGASIVNPNGTPPVDVLSGMNHDPQSGRHAYRGNPGTKAFQRAAAKRRRVRAHKARAR